MVNFRKEFNLLAKFYFISLGGATFPNQGDNHNDRPFDFTTSGIFVIFVTFQLKPLIISDLKQNSSEVDLTITVLTTAQ